jgi:DNA-binding YbaB/EbfC family protein
VNQLQQMLKQAQKIQNQMTEAQEKLAAQEVQGTSGGGLVTVTVNGRAEMKRIKVDPSLLTPEEGEVLEDLIIAAYNDAKSKAESMMSEEMGKITGGLGLPPGFQFPL